MTRNTLRTLALAWGLTFAVPALAEITFYEHDDFGGESFTVEDSVTNFDRYGFNDRASSAVVRGTAYQVCEDAGFRGRCVTLSPGEYRSFSVMDMNDKISSARAVGGGGLVGRQPPVSGPGPGPAQGRSARAVLFSRENLEGRGVVLEGRRIARNLEDIGFNDRAASLRIERGYWMFCSDADFEGECRTFGPGEYPTLPGELDRRISSGRPINDRYPYRDRPNWNGY